MKDESALDTLDEQILWELLRDARTPNNVLAEKLHVSPSTTLTRVRALRERGVLKSSHAIIDLHAVGLHVQAIVAVRLRAQARAQMKTYAAKVMRMPSVLSAYFIGGADDFMIHVACASTEQLRDFVSINLSMDPAVASTQTNIVFDYFHGGHFIDSINGFSDMRAPITDPASAQGMGERPTR
ncbi:Lrp/AsnC family transcriptional regulator [Microbacterium sp. NPDC091313]